MLIYFLVLGRLFSPFVLNARKPQWLHIVINISLCSVLCSVPIVRTCMIGLSCNRSIDRHSCDCSTEFRIVSDFAYCFCQYLLYRFIIIDKFCSFLGAIILLVVGSYLLLSLYLFLDNFCS